MKTPSHPWSCRQRLRTRAFGWRGSKLAIERLKEALGEIKTVARTDPETAAEGAHLERQLDRLWTAIEEDGVDFLSEARDRWGELCRTPERASRAADDFLPALRLSWSPEHRGYFKGTTACLSCLLAGERHQELLDPSEPAPLRSGGTTGATACRRSPPRGAPTRRSTTRSSRWA
jgi:hypothetical protein